MLPPLILSKTKCSVRREEVELPLSGVQAHPLQIQIVFAAAYHVRFFWAEMLAYGRFHFGTRSCCLFRGEN